MNSSNPLPRSNPVIWLCAVISLLASIAAISGLCWEDGGRSFAFTTLRGDTVQIYGHGLYRYDTTLTAIGFKAGDAVTLLLAIPILLFSLLRYRRGSLRGGLMLTGTLAYLLYAYGSMAFGAAYNNLFLVYLTLLSASLFGLIFALTSFNLQTLPKHFSPRLSHPHRLSISTDNAGVYGNFGYQSHRWRHCTNADGTNGHRSIYRLCRILCDPDLICDWIYRDPLAKCIRLAK